MPERFEIYIVCKLSYINTFFPFLFHAAWRSGNGVGRINEVTLRRARLVLGWVTCPGSTPGGGTLFRYVTSHPRPTQPFIFSGSINWVVSSFIGCVPLAPSGECSRGYAGAVDSIAVRRVWQQFSRLNPPVYSAALRGGCCVPPSVADVSIVNCAVCQQFNKRTL